MSAVPRMRSFETVVIGPAQAKLSIAERLFLMDTAGAELVGSVEQAQSAGLDGPRRERVGPIDYDARRRHFAHCGVLDPTASQTQAHAGLHGVSMSDYPSTQPFGPHGPQVPANGANPEGARRNTDTLQRLLPCC